MPGTRPCDMSDADMPSVPLSRDAALHRVRVLLGSLYDEDRVSTEARDALLSAIIDYGHACATEAVNALAAFLPSRAGQ